MPSIFMGSVSPFSGKNVIGLGLAQHFRKEGRKVGYFKPIGPLSTRAGSSHADEDAVLFKEALALTDPLDAICPLVLSADTFAKAMRGGITDARDRIMKAYAKVAAGKDVVLVGGMGRLSAGLFLGFSAEQFIKETGAQMIIAEKYRAPYEVIDAILYVKRTLGKQFSGVIFNRIDAAKRAQIEGELAPFFAKQSIDVLGIVPEDPVLAAVPVSEIVDSLHAQVLVGRPGADILIERFLVGAMNVEAALTHFRRAPNKAVITGGDRPDIQLAALETDAKCLILTGDLPANERILTEAERREVPVLLVSTHTGATLEACEKLAEHLGTRSAQKLLRVAETVDRALDFTALKQKLGVR